MPCRLAHYVHADDKNAADDYLNRYILIIVRPGLDTPARLFGPEIASLLKVVIG